MTTASQQENKRSLAFTVPLVPPSVNHYKQPCVYRDRSGVTRKGQRITPEAIAYKAAVAIFARGETIIPAAILAIPKLSSQKYQLNKLRYTLRCVVVLGRGQRGDGDNFFKCIADGLQEAGVIHSDARIKHWNIDVDSNDRDNPRTEIHVELIPPPATSREKLKRSTTDGK